jgi:hypothetical protein
MLRSGAVYTIFLLLVAYCSVQAQDPSRAILQRKLTAEG